MDDLSNGLVSASHDTSKASSAKDYILLQITTSFECFKSDDVPCISSVGTSADLPASGAAA